MIITTYYVIALTEGRYFHAHTRYNAYDGNPENGLYVMDEENKQHYLSPSYLMANFEIGVEYVTI